MGCDWYRVYRYTYHLSDVHCTHGLWLIMPAITHRYNWCIGHSHTLGLCYASSHTRVLQVTHCVSFRSAIIHECSYTLGYCYACSHTWVLQVIQWWNIHLSYVMPGVALFVYMYRVEHTHTICCMSAVIAIGTYIHTLTNQKTGQCFTILWSV